MIGLGTLGGPNFPSLNSEGAGSNWNGVVAIISEIPIRSYMNEDFCGFGTHLQCLAAVWKNGEMKALETKDKSYNSQAYGINNQGQIIGFSENGVPGSNCFMPFQVRHFDAVIWGPNGEIQKILPPLPEFGDEVTFAFGINDKGQAVGGSGKCSDTNLPPGNAGGPPLRRTLCSGIRTTHPMTSAAWWLAAPFTF